MIVRKYRASFVNIYETKEMKQRKNYSYCAT